VRHTKRDDWRGNRIKERELRNAIRAEIDGNEEHLMGVFELVKNQNGY
jgi:type I restriction enzyme R subunit